MNNVKSLSSSAMLVSLSISLWTARKLDKKVSNDVDISNSTMTKAGNYHKNLLAGDTSIAAIQKLAGLIRTYHLTQTSPWNDNGARLLTTSQFFIYKNEMARLEKQYWDLVKDFVAGYGTRISAAAFQLGSLFDRDEYPDVEQVTDKFGFRVNYAPLPESGDFRIDINNEGLNDLKDSYDALYEANIEKISADNYDRLYKILTQLSFGLRTNEDDGTKGKMYESVLDNAKALCGLLTHFNVKQDTQLEAMRLQLEENITGLNCKDIKDSDYVRVTLKKEVDSMLDGIWDRTDDILGKF
jgi:hypothetical protein